MSDFQGFEQSSLKLNYNFIEVPMAAHYEEPGACAKKISAHLPTENCINSV